MCLRSRLPCNIVTLHDDDDPPLPLPTPLPPPPQYNTPNPTARDPFVLEKPCESNGWRWRVMVGSNISLAHWLSQGMMPTARHSTPERPLPTVDSLAGSSADESPAESSSSSSSSVDGLSAAAAVAAGVSAAGGHEETLGTATVYRSRTKELEGGAWQHCWQKQAVQAVPWGTRVAAATA